LRQLETLFSEGGAAAIYGEAGVGKTTLARAFATSRDELLAEAGALATLQWMPYFPVRRLLRRDLAHEDPAVVADLLERNVPPAVLLLDDLHWADDRTLALVPWLVGRVPLLLAIRRGDGGAPRALDAAAAAGCELLVLETLPDEEALELLARRSPSLTASAARAVVRRAGGNPLLLEELAATGEASESLLLAVSARLRQLPPQSRRTMGLLALAQRPVPRSWCEGDAQELIGAGLAVASRARVTLRHALVADAMVALLGGEETCELHKELARRIRDPGESARHHGAAGEDERCFVKAMRAAGRASTPGEHAAHLALAAAHASGDDADSLRLRAARLLADIGDFRGAVELLDAVGEGAEAALIRGRAAIANREFERARDLLAEAARLAERGGDVEVEIAIARARLSVEMREDLELQKSATEHALAAARARGTHVGAALHATAMVDEGLDRPTFYELLRDAVVSAREEGDVATECAAADALCIPSADVRDVAAEMIERTSSLGLTAWERRFRCRLAGIDFHAGAFRAAYEAGEDLLGVALEPWERFLVAYYAAQAAGDLGYHDRSRQLVEELDRLSAHRHDSRRQALWARTDLELLAGRPTQALAASERVLSEFPEDTSTFTRLARAWALYELGRKQDDAGELRAMQGFLAGAAPELEAIAALATGEVGDAADGFARAAALWRGCHARGWLRCLWAEGEAHRLADHTSLARERLLEAERRAVEHEHAVFLTRIHRSLRLVGERRASARARGRRGLTAREQEILALVATGLSNAEIARRLGIGRPTVERQIASASAKLGVRSRIAAAASATRG
jgi:DNA-binding CsgD family transcriptional regulator